MKMARNICNHYRFGFCKYKDKNQCNKRHIEVICNERTTCTTKNCNLRHPKACKRYTLKKYCRCGDSCAYYHVKENTKEVNTIDLGEGLLTMIVCNDYYNHRKYSEKVVPMVASKKNIGNSR